MKKSNRMTRIGLGSVLMTVLCLLLSCGKSGQEGGVSKSMSTLERVRQAGAIRIGYANEAPYAYMDREQGKLTGEAPEIARVVLKRMGVGQIEGVLTEFGSLIPALKAGKIDVIAAGMYITPKRCQEIAFSNPTYGIGEAFIVPEGNPLDLHGYEDVAADPEVLLGIVAGTVEKDYADASGIAESQIVVFPDPPSALSGVQAGRVSAYAGTSLTIQDLLNKIGDGGVERADPFSDPVVEGKTVRGYGAFGFRKDDTDLREAFNKELANLIGSQEHLDLIAPFGFTEKELPGEVTAESLCAGKEVETVDAK